MAELPRLNGVIRALEAGQHALTCFAPAELNTAIAMSAAKFDGCVFEMEHQPWDGRLLRDCLQYMLNRAQIAKAASVVPGVTPMARVPVNGAEMAQWQAKQALDMGCYGIVFPHISTVEEAANAVGACRYPRLKSAPRYEPAGIRGDGPTAAARYWGLSQQDYYQKADVWPLNPQGEIFCILQIEDTRGVENLDDILKNVPGIGCILIGEGDLSQELGYPRQYEHKVVLEWMKRVVDTCKKHNVVVGHPHVEQGNVERIIKEGYRLLDVRAGAELRPPRSGKEAYGKGVTPRHCEDAKRRGRSENGVRPTGLLRSARNDGASLHPQPALLLDEARDLVDALAGAQIGEDEGPRAAHALTLALHGFQRSADIGRQIDLVDHQEIGAGDARPAFRGNLVAGGDVDDVDGEIGQLRRKRRGEIVAAGFDQHQIEAGEFLPHVGDGREIGRSVLADRGVRAAAGLDAGDAVGHERAGAHQIFGVPFGVDVVGDRGDLVAVAQPLAQRVHQRGLAGTDRAADTDAQGAMGVDMR